MQEKKHGKTIKLFLVDGDPDGKIICELSNWDGKAYKIPRQQVAEYKSELNFTAVYLLLGKAESPDSKPLVYIGETENFCQRLNNHESKKDFWNETIVFTRKDTSLINKAHVKYLEAELYKIAKEVGRYEMENNKQTPNKPTIAESDEAEMDEFIDYVKILTDALGHKVFEPLPSITIEETKKLRLKTKDVEAYGVWTSEGFTVFQDSQARLDTLPSIGDTIKKLIKKLKKEEVLVEKEGKLVFSTDYSFSSPSSAAGVVVGGNASGLDQWKNAEGKSLKELEAKPSTE